MLRPRATGRVLGHVLQADADRIGAALESLSARRWLRPAGVDGWEFGHQLTGEAIYAGLALAHRSFLHRLAASALITVFPAESGPAAAEIAAHLDEGAGPPQELARWGVLAGRWAAEQLSYRRAEEYFELARAGVEKLGGGREGRALALAVHEGLGTVRPLVGRSTEALRSLESAHSFAEAPDDRARLLLGTIAAAAGDLETAERLAREAREISAGAQQILALGRAERLLGVVLAEDARFAESEAIFRRVEALIELGETLLARATRDDLLEARRRFRRARARPLLRQAELLLHQLI